MAHIRIDNRYYKLPEFIEFRQKKESMVLEFLISSAIRGNVEGAEYIYNTFYKDHKLVARYSQEDMAKYLKTDKAVISRCTTSLHNQKLIKKIHINRYNTNLCYYQVGIWKGVPGEKDTKYGYGELLFFDKVFGALADIKSDMEYDVKYAKKEIERLEKEIKKLDKTDMWYEDDLLSLQKQIKFQQSMLSQ